MENRPFWEARETRQRGSRREGRRGKIGGPQILGSAPASRHGKRGRFGRGDPPRLRSLMDTTADGHYRSRTPLASPRQAPATDTRHRHPPRSTPQGTPRSIRRGGKVRAVRRADLRRSKSAKEPTREGTGSRGDRLHGRANPWEGQPMRKTSGGGRLGRDSCPPGGPPARRGPQHRGCL